MKKFNFKDIPLDDEKTWDLFCSGQTKGIFQCESHLVQAWLKKIKPRNIKELSAVIALVRPGALNSGLAEIFYQRRIGEIPDEPFHTALTDITKDTHHIILFQETVLEICKKIAGFTDVEADLARRAIGKKDTEEMSKVKKMFLEGCEKTKVVSNEVAEEIFSWIQKSVRYLFNECLSPDTLVETQDGLKELQEVNIGDFVNSDIGFVEVINKFNKGIQEVYKIELQYGKTIECTLNHEFMCDGYRKLPLWKILFYKTKILTESGKENITSINYVREKPTLDIEVDHPQHVFYANGILTSNSHSISYALNAYASGYLKTNFPEKFLCSWLTFSSDKADPQQEVYDLVIDGKLAGLNILPPDIQIGNTDFQIVSNNDILFGLQHIRGIGEKAVKPLVKYKNKLKNWESFLANTKLIKRNVAESLIKSGACDSFGKTRSYMLQQLYVVFGQGKSVNPVLRPLSDKELAFWQKNIDTMTTEDILAEIIKQEICTKKRVEVIENKLEYLSRTPKDSNIQKAIYEKIYLGLSLSVSAVDDFAEEIENSHSCKEAYEGQTGESFTVYGVIDKIQERRTGPKSKNPGEKYVYMSISDNSGGLNNLVCWPQNYERFASAINEDAVAKFVLYKDSWQGREQMVVNDMELII